MNLFANPMIGGLVLPLILGLVIGAAGLSAPLRAPLAGAILWALAVVLIYLSVESLPPFPPAAAKQKLFYAIAAAGVAGIFGFAFVNGKVSGTATALGALALLAWFAWPRLGQDGIAALLLPPAYAAALTALGIGALSPLGRSGNSALAAPIAFLLFAIGAAIVALLGAFIGMAQLFGAFAAALGGYVLAAYSLGLAGLSSPTFGPAQVFVAGMALLAAYLVTGLLATSLDVAAYLILPLVLPAAWLADRWLPSTLPAPAALRPIALGVMAAIPAAVAIAVAATSSAGPP